MDVLVFITNVSAPEQVREVSPLLSSLQAIEDWNFDLDDCDRILRVVSDTISPRYIETLLQTAGYTCVELK